MKRVTNFALSAFGILLLIQQFLGMYIILFLLGIISKNYLLFLLIAIVFTILDLLRHYYFKRQGMHVEVGGYKK